MASQGEIDRVVAVVHETLNDQGVDSFDRGRIEELITEALGGEPRLSVDDGGGLHDETGARIGAVRRSDSGEWIVERQNAAAERSDTAIPKPGPQSRLRQMLTKLKVQGR